MAAEQHGKRMAKIQKITERVYCGVYFALILDRRHASQDGRFPVSVRITHNYKQVYVVVGMRMTPSEYEKVAKSGKGEQYRQRQECEAVFDNVYMQAKRMIDSGDFGFAELRGKVTGKNGDTLDSVFAMKVDAERRNGKFSTARLYETAMRKIKSYYGEMKLSDVSVSWVNDFKRRMEADGTSRTTQGIYLRHLRAVCNIALSEGRMTESQYPFRRSAGDSGKVRMMVGSQRIDWYLTVEDMRKLYECELDGEERLCVSLFLFSYLANGINLADMADLRYDRGYFGSGRRLLTFVRKKTEDTGTGLPIRIPVTIHLRRVMERIAAPEEPNGLVFPFIAHGQTGESAIHAIGGYGKRVSKALGSVCPRLGINGKVSMTWARHSFKTNLIRQRVPDHYCEMAMGHADRSVGAYYVAPFTIEDMMDYNSMLL